MKLTYRPFPPGLAHIKVPLSSRRAAVSALALYSACRPRAVWMHRVALVSAQLFGARALPGRSVDWSPPMGMELWRELCEVWRREIGAFDDAAISERAQRLRSGFAVLLLDRGRPRAFLKVRQRGADVLGQEHRAMERVWNAGPRSFSIPEPLGLGGVSGWDYVAASALPSPRHRVPVNPPLAEIAAEIGAALAEWPREAGAPEHWRPMHGDLTPWNLRALPDGRLVLFDWESAAWAPPGADEVLYRACDAVIGGPPPVARGADEAARYWLAQVRARGEDTARDRRLDQLLTDALERMLVGTSPPGAP